MTRSLLLDLYELTMAQGYFLYKRNTLATFDLFVRELPVNRNYLVACGLEDVLAYLRNLKFYREDLRYLAKQRIFCASFLKYLSKFRFSGDVWALPEGEVFFPNEPILRVTAPIIEAQIVESFLLNTVNLQSMIASKAARVVSAAAGRRLYDFSLRRTHGPEAGVKVARAAYIAGFDGTSNVLAGKLYGIPVAGTMAHSYVMSFKYELDSFLAYARAFPAKTILLVDTYDAQKGIENAVKTGLYLKAQGYRLSGIRLDSGDITGLSKLARRMLDRAGLKYVQIFASGNLDEFKIKKLIQGGACVDSFGVGTNMGTSIDAPCLDVIYKVSEVSDASGAFLPTMKLSRAKVTYPGRKQVLRVIDSRGRFVRDILALADENIKGKPLLVKVVAKGKVIYKTPPLEKVRKFFRSRLRQFPPALMDLEAGYKYPLVISPGLKKLQATLSRHLKERQLIRSRPDAEF
jgi:nicotinate phosphoribosyltransferase